MKKFAFIALTAFVAATPAAFAHAGPARDARLLAHAGAAERYEGGTALRHAATPQKAQAFAQADSSGTSETMYGRRVASEQTGVDNGRPA